MDWSGLGVIPAPAPRASGRCRSEEKRAEKRKIPANTQAPSRKIRIDCAVNSRCCNGLRVSGQKLARGFAQKVAKLKFSPLWSCEEIGIGRSPPCITARRWGRALKNMIAKPPLNAWPG